MKQYTGKSIYQFMKMEKTMKKFFALALAAALALCVFAGCSLKPQSENTDVPVATDVDRDATVVTVGDQAVTMGEYIDLFNTYASYYTNYGYDIYSDPTALNEFQDFVVDLLAEDKIIAYQAQKAGITELSEEQLKEIEDKVAEELEYLLDTYRAQAEEEAAADSTVDVEARTKELMEAETEYYTGSSMTYDEFVEWIRTYYKESAVSEAFREEVLKDITVSQEAIQKWYDDTLATQKTTYADDGGAYKTDAENYEKYGGVPVVYIPEGYSRVLHILITPEGEPSEEYTAKTDEMDSLAAEYGELAFDSAISGANNPRLAEILTAYKALDKEAQALEETRMASALTKANEVFAKLEAGEDFATLMSEYTQDDAILSFDNVAKKGLLISNKYESEADWSKDVKTAFSTLKMGEYSQVIRDEEGCHILYYLSDETTGPVALDTVKTDVETVLLTDLQDQEWTSMLETWKNDGSVKIDEELVRSYDGSVG